MEQFYYPSGNGTVLSVVPYRWSPGARYIDARRCTTSLNYDF